MTASKYRRKNIFPWTLIFFLFAASHLFAQENILSAGFQFKPIIPSGLFRTGPSEGTVDSVDFKISQKMGFVFGMVIDATIWKNIQMETGICFTQRNYALEISDGDFTGKSSFRIIGYEIPLSALVSLPITQQLRINNSLGIVL